MPSYKIVEYACEACGRVRESLEERAAPAASVPCFHPKCKGTAVPCMSSPKVGTKWGYATPTKWTEPDPPPGVVDTREYARKRGVDI